MIAGFERTGEELARADREALAALADDPDPDEMADLALPMAASPAFGSPAAYAAPQAPRSALDHGTEMPGAAPRPAKPEPVGAGVPAPPPEPAPPLNRRQRRALERLRRKELRADRRAGDAA